MAITKQKKEEIGADIKDRMMNSEIVVAVNFHGMSVSLETELRSALRAVGAKYIVAKKTLVRRVLGELQFSGAMPEMEGELALAFGKDDAVATAQALQTFAKGHAEQVKLVGGIFENAYIGGETVVMLASIPPKPVLLGMFVNVINSPIQGFASVLNNTISSLTTVLQNVADKR